MDRAIVYAGSIPLDTDLLRVGKYGKAAIGHMSDMLYGRGIVAASGLACTPSSSSLAVTIGAGSITAPGVMDAAPLGGAGGGYRADPTQTTCQYSSDTAVTVTVPGTGASYTVFAICSEQDIDQTVLAFFNAANPSQTQAGLNNSGDVLPTRRWAGMSFVIATDAPAAPMGGTVVPLYTLTVPQGVTSLAGVQPQPGQAFWPTIPELATQTLLRAIAEPMQLVANDTSLSIPAWATRVELRVIGGGGGGASSSSTLLTGSFSGAGGGGGGDAWGIYGVSPTSGGALGLTIGRGGASEQTGGTSLVSYNGQTLLQASGGHGGFFYDTTGSAGGDGGTASGGTIWNQTGSWGGDGQSNASTFAGYGGDGPWGGGGRCGNQVGRDGTRFGAGGGGSYSAAVEGTPTAGGSGFSGCVMYRFLP
ncbi:hypothetical protein Gbfr_006_009 [Gluconobacter frateurii M-2]|nr:hypothetical protein Gbfr_006_009 [Gluconobacter frateurii M-2]